MTERDATLRRVERVSLYACAALAAGAVVMGAGAAGAAGVLAGGALTAISYHGVKAGVDAARGAGPEEDGRRGRRAAGLVKFFTRYAILAAVAGVIVARVRLPPVAVVAGASSLVIAVALEALRSFRRNPPGHVD